MTSPELFDYADLLAQHRCHCGGSLALRPYPVGVDFVAAVCCTRCFNKKGLPTKYSTESKPVHSLAHAEQTVEGLLKQRAFGMDDAAREALSRAASRGRWHP